MPIEVSQGDRLLRVIVLYKSVKAVLWLALAAGLLLSVGRLRTWLPDVETHFTAAWSRHFVEWLMQKLTPSYVHLTVAALIADATLTGVEAWALHTRRPWGEWLVVVATSGLIPFEIYAMVEHPTVTRALILVLNAAVVVYLVRRRLAARRGP